MTVFDDTEPVRIDHEGFVPEIWAGLFLTALYFMQQGPMIGGLADRLEDAMALLLFVGSTVCLFGALLGTPLFFPAARRRLSYIIELCGLPMIIATMGMYTWGYAADTRDLLVTALGGGLGLTIEIGAVRMAVDLLRSIASGKAEEEEIQHREDTEDGD